MTFSFPKSSRLRSSKQFQEVERWGHKRVGNHLVVFILPHKQQAQRQAKLGITASRRFGGAVERNRFKRKMREAFRQCRSRLTTEWIHVKPRPSALKATFSQLQTEFLALIHKNPPHPL